VTDFLPLRIHSDDEFVEIFAVQLADECLRCIFLSVDPATFQLAELPHRRPVRPTCGDRLLQQKGLSPEGNFWHGSSTGIIFQIDSPDRQVNLAQQVEAIMEKGNRK
jgi:hypothetical protein